MARQSNATDFFGVRYGRADAMYDEYQEYPFFAQRAQHIATNYPNVGKVCVAACGPYAYLVKHLVVTHGIDAYGFDWCNKTPFGETITLDPAIANRVLLDVDVSNNSDVTRIKGRDYADLKGNAKFGLVVTEDLLPCTTDSEAQFLAGYLSSQGTNVLHIITCGQPTDAHRDPTLNWKTQAEWRALLNANGGSAHACLDAETQGVF
jgi:hypothetical protein